LFPSRWWTFTRTNCHDSGMVFCPWIYGRRVVFTMDNGATMTAEIIMLKDRRKPVRLPPTTAHAEQMLKEVQLEHDLEKFSALSDAELDEFRFIFGEKEKRLQIRNAAYVPQAPKARVAFADAMILASPETRAKVGRILDDLEAVLGRRKP